MKISDDSLITRYIRAKAFSVLLTTIARHESVMNKSELRKPNVTEEMAKDFVQDFYGLEVTSIERMSSFNDQNFHIQVSQCHYNPFISHVCSEGYTLKIINTMKSSLDHHFDSMHSGMVHLGNKGIRVPQPVINLKGQSWTLENVPLLNKDGSSCSMGRCGVHLLTYISGEILVTGINSPDILFQWGLLVAKFHNALEDLISPGLRGKTNFYNLEHIPDIVDRMEGLDKKKKKLVYNVLERYPIEIMKNLDNLPKGFIHGDANGYNILKQVQQNGQISIDGMLDFEDMHYGTYIWDIGLMLSHSMIDFKCMDPLDQAGHTLAGYLSIRSLNELELSLLKMCIECRLCQSAVICEYSSKIDPSNSYISKLASTETKWIILEQFCEIKSEDLLLKWRTIRQQYQSI